MHLRYWKYVILHKLYVFAGGMAVKRVFGDTWRGWIAWVWRLLVHDWSKFLPGEWMPYATFFYADDANFWIALKTRWFIEHGGARPEDARASAEGLWSEEKKRRMAAFQRAWLSHQHRNPHHWQHWILREDSGKTLVLIPPSVVIDEMIADWLGAGTKILGLPTMAECVGETVKWYMANRTNIVLRDIPRVRVEETLHALAARYGLVDMAYQVELARRGRVLVEVAR